MPEWNALGESVQQGQSKSRLLLILGLMLEDATPSTKKISLQPPVYARAVWHTLGVASYRRYVRRVRAGSLENTRIAPVRRGLSRFHPFPLNRGAVDDRA